MIDSNLYDELTSYSSPALEAINFQVSSKFPKELQATFQEVYDYVAQYNRDMNIDPKLGVKDNEEAKDKHVAIRKYLKDNTEPALKSIVKKHTNIDVKGIISDVPINNANIGSIFCWFTKPSEALSKLVVAAEGYDIKINTGSKDIMDEREIAKSLNRDTGKIMKSVKSNEIYIGLPVSVFTYSDFLPKHLGKDQFDAEELTAVILHEIGHIVGFIESAITMAYTHRYGNNALRAVMNEAESDPKAVLTQLKRVDKRRINKLLKPIKVDADSLIASLTKAEEDGYADNWLFKLILKVLQSMLVGIIFNTVSFVNSIFMFVQPWSTDANSDSKTSQSFGDNAKNRTMYERMADEYVSRYGYSRPLNSALIKLDHTFTYLATVGEHPARFSQTARNSWTLQLIHLTLNFNLFILMAQFSIASSNMSSYEQQEMRLKRNMQNLRDGLADPNIPLVVKRQFIQDLDTMARDLKKYQRSGLRNVGMVYRFLLTALPKVVSAGFRTTLRSGELSRTYGKYLSQIDEVLSNRGHETAARIRSMISK